MSKQYPGGFITKNPTAPTSSAAPGIWTLDQAQQYIKAGTWPLPVVLVDYLVIAGGGGGGGWGSSTVGAGGGGAGGYRTASSFSVATGSAITVTVGAGGSGGTGVANGSAGNNSVF